MMLGSGEFATIGVLLLVVAGLTVVILLLTHLIGPKRSGPTKDSTYESGMAPIGDTRRRFNVRFYLVAVLYLVFGVEIVFLYPWAVMFPQAAEGLRNPDSPHHQWARALADMGYSPAYLFGAILVFFVLLAVGFIYEWRKGLFRWE